MIPGKSRNTLTRNVGFSDPEYTRQRKSRIAATFSIIAAFVFLVFVVDNIIKLKVNDVIIDSLFLIFLSFFPLLIRRMKKQEIWIMSILLVLILMVVRLIYSGPSSRGGNLIWFMVFPVVSFLMLGQKKGIIPIAMAALILMLVLYFPELVHFKMELAARFKFHIIFGYTTFCCAAWLYEYHREKLELSLRDSWKTVQIQKAKLSDANTSLKTLISETNHRINNNLNMISALIYLYKTNDLDKDQALSELNDKILSIGKSNYMLYAGGSGADINMRTYLIELIGQLEQTFAVKKPNILIDIDPISFHPDSAVRLGLIVNELVTNACKYGIYEKGTISIRLKPKRDRIILKVANDGNKFPENIDIASTDSIGFSIIRNIVDYLDAEISLAEGESTVIEISLPEKLQNSGQLRSMGT